MIDGMMEVKEENESNNSGSEDEESKQSHSISGTDSDSSSSDAGTVRYSDDDEDGNGNEDDAEPDVPGSRVRTPDVLDTSKFACGNAFEEMVFETGKDNSLCIEDVQKSSKQLWLIKAPYNFNVSALKNQELLLNAEQMLTCKSSHGKTKYNMMAMENEQNSSVHALLPSRQSNKLIPGPAFKGHITIIESVAVLPISLPPTPPRKMHDLPAGLKQRFVPFGCDEPVRYPDSPPHSPKKKKKKKEDKDNTGSSSASEDHRKAHKRKIKTEVPDSEDGEALVKKKKKKHKTKI